MPSNIIYTHINEIDFSPTDLPKRPPEQSILLVSPEHYDVLYVINPHMKGNVGTVDKTNAINQWNNLKKTYESLGYPVHTIESVPKFPDMVFCANQSFPYLDTNDQPTVIMSKMTSIYRQGEEVYFDRWYEQNNYRVIRQITPPVDFEGMGDVIWHPRRRLLYAGYGYRTEKSALQRLAKCVGYPVVGLQLIHPSFYHLDTAFAPIDEQTALYVKEAFTPEGEAILQYNFPRLIQVPLAEAQYGFVTNGHCPDGKHFIVQHGNDQTCSVLKQLGYTILEIDTSEFLKSGGSVFCLKMMLPTR